MGEAGHRFHGVQGPDGKVYKSLMVDVFDGTILDVTMSNSPNSDLTRANLHNVMAQALAGATPVVYTDRGWHYNHHSWTASMAHAGWVQSRYRRRGALLIIPPVRGCSES